MSSTQTQTHLEGGSGSGSSSLPGAYTHTHDVPDHAESSVIDGIRVFHNYPHTLQSIQPDSHPKPFPLKQWLERQKSASSSSSGSGSSENASRSSRDGYVYEKGCQFELQVRRGPHVHRTFHVQSGEEWVYVMEGHALIKVFDGREVRDVVVGPGCCYLIGGGVCKSMQLSRDAVALVLNRQRKTQSPDSYPHRNKNRTIPHLQAINQQHDEPLDEKDQFIVFCPKCGGIAEKKEFECEEYYGQMNELSSSFDKRVGAGHVRCPTCQTVFDTAWRTTLPDEQASTAEDGNAIQTLLGTSIPSQLHSSTPSFPTIDSTIYPPPYHLFSWIDAHRHLLAPPVGNRMIHSNGTQWKVMIVGGPNQRTDYHIDDGEEWFLMIQGDMCLKVVDKNGTEFRDIIIREGESFLLPANVPHSPQRLADTIGLVIERDRFSYELDGLRWYCSNASCRAVLHTFSFKCEDLGTQLKTLIHHWYAGTPEAKERRTCKKCGQEETRPKTIDDIKQFSH